MRKCAVQGNKKRGTTWKRSFFVRCYDVLLSCNRKHRKKLQNNISLKINGTSTSSTDELSRPSCCSHLWPTLQSVAGQTVPADTQLQPHAELCDNSCSRVMGSDRRFIPRSCDRNTAHTPLLRDCTVCVWVTYCAYCTIWMWQKWQVYADVIVTCM